MSDKRTTIRRVPSRDQYVVIDKRGLRDTGLSWKAKGVLCYILTLPDDWEVNLSELHRHSRDGRESTASGFHELIAAGYAEVDSQPRKVDGRFEVKRFNVNEVSEQPDRFDYKGRPVWETRNGLPVTGNPQRETRNGLPATDNPRQLNKELLSNDIVITEIQNTDNGGSDDLSVAGAVTLFDLNDPSPEKKKVPAKKKSQADFRADADQVIDELNLYAGRKYATGTTRGAEANRKKVTSLLRKGYPVDEITDMIMFKVYQWKGGKMEQYLQPSTLFGGKAEQYIQEAGQAKTDPAFAAKVQEWKAADLKETGGIVLTSKTADVLQDLANEW